MPAERGGGKGGHGAELKEGAGEEEGGEGGETTPLVADLPEWAKEVEMPSS